MQKPKDTDKSHDIYTHVFVRCLFSTIYRIFAVPVCGLHNECTLLFRVFLRRTKSF